MVVIKIGIQGKNLETNRHFIKNKDSYDVLNMYRFM
jgi:hypothetical protein